MCQTDGVSFNGRSHFPSNWCTKIDGHQFQTTTERTVWKYFRVRRFFSYYSYFFLQNLGPVTFWWIDEFTLFFKHRSRERSLLYPTSCTKSVADRAANNLYTELPRGVSGWVGGHGHEKFVGREMTYWWKSSDWRHDRCRPSEKSFSTTRSRSKKKKRRQNTFVWHRRIIFLLARRMIVCDRQNTRTPAVCVPKPGVNWIYIFLVKQ